MLPRGLYACGNFQGFLRGQIIFRQQFLLYVSRVKSTYKPICNGIIKKCTKLAMLGQFPNCSHELSYVLLFPLTSLMEFISFCYHKRLGLQLIFNNVDEFLIRLFLGLCRCYQTFHQAVHLGTTGHKEKRSFLLLVSNSVSFKEVIESFRVVRSTQSNLPRPRTRASVRMSAF